MTENWRDSIWAEAILDEVDKLVKSAVEAEREACAAEMDRRALEVANSQDMRAAYRNGAHAIRARGA